MEGHVAQHKCDRMGGHKKLLIAQSIGFLALVVLSWIDEYLLFPSRLLPAWVWQGGWREALVETLAIAIVGAAVISYTVILQRRVERLERLLKVCAWCRKVDLGGKWIPMEEYLELSSHTACTHGMCEECAGKFMVDSHGAPRSA